MIETDEETTEIPWREDPWKMFLTGVALALIPAVVVLWVAIYMLVVFR